MVLNLGENKVYLVLGCPLVSVNMWIRPCLKPVGTSIIMESELAVSNVLKYCPLSVKGIKKPFNASS